MIKFTNTDAGASATVRNPFLEEVEIRSMEQIDPARRTSSVTNAWTMITMTVLLGFLIALKVLERSFELLKNHFLRNRKRRRKQRA